MTALNAILRLNSDIRFRVMDDEAVIVCQNAGEIIAVNGIGRQIIEAAERQKSIDTVLQEMQSEYDVPVENLQQDLLAFIEEMTAAGVLGD
jgi:hypothetical protein